MREIGPKCGRLPPGPRSSGVGRRPRSRLRIELLQGSYLLLQLPLSQGRRILRQLPLHMRAVSAAARPCDQPTAGDLRR